LSFVRPNITNVHSIFLAFHIIQQQNTNNITSLYPQEEQNNNKQDARLIEAIATNCYFT